jgi:ATP-dependent Clp protease adaptor protein ClpS
MANYQNGSMLAPERPKLKPPRMFKVIIFNDDYTTAKFVVKVLQQFFAMNFERAEQIMWQSHNEGQSICGAYSRDVAETKISQVSTCALQNEQPLRCVMEAA